jgi:hypothetical protein
MKKLFLLIVVVSFAGLSGFAQNCTPRAATGNPGIDPPTDSLACAEIGVYYDETIYIENFSSFNSPLGNATVDSLRIDSITNLPCGLDYQVNPDNTLNSGQTGCISLFGTTLDQPGQYHAGIYLTVWATVPLLGQQHYSGRADSLIAQLEGLTGQSLGIDFNYWVRVIQQGNACPPIDTTGASDLTAAASCLTAGSFIVNITGNSQVCDGDNTTLTANIAGSPIGTLLYVWSTGSNDDSIVVTAPDTVTLTITDSLGTTESDTFIVAALFPPVASLTATTNGAQATATSTSSGNPTTTVFAVLGVDTNNTGVFTFTANGDYTIYLVATNDCGSDTSSQTVTITGVSVPEINNIGASISLYPNPSNGKVQLTINSTVTSENYSVKVYNMQGREVYTAEYSGNVNAAIDMENVSAGVYFVHINSKNVSTVEKLLIK